MYPHSHRDGVIVEIDNESLREMKNRRGITGPRGGEGGQFSISPIDLTGPA